MSNDDYGYGGSGGYGQGGGMGGGYGQTLNASVGGAPAQPAAPAEVTYTSGGRPVGEDAPAAPGVFPVLDVTTETFMKDVIDASMDHPVVVDFWAPWCGPCKTLGPIIEKVASQTPGVQLVKMDTEANPEVPQQMRIQSIPAVVAFVNGRPAEAFMGAKPESEVAAFFDKIAKMAGVGSENPMAEALAEADRLAGEGDPGAASELYGAILGREPGNLDAIAGLGQCYVAVGEADMAQQLIDQVPEQYHGETTIAALIKAIDLAQAGSKLGELEPLKAAVEATPQDHQARFDYAMALNAAGDREEAAEQLLEIVRADRTWNEDGARKQLVEFFDAWGNADPATVAGRRGLSSVLFS
ncbi:MAG: co-chaperone YbbN [Pseudomonadota bacterium]